ncbi:MAG: DUF2090 domain-containing protein [Candidatus Pacebacteria bacterium]|nr:DUF2090 domain-containing protein [Candidatus Paceibacterota bacterium]
MPENNELFVLPFDHRGSFLEEMFGVLGGATEEDKERVRAFKKIIYEGFKIAIERGAVPKESGAILVDEEFGDEILQDAKKNGYRFAICAEKSGQKEFELEFGENFAQHIDKYRPEFVKVLVRYNPDDDADLNERQVEKLKVLSDFCREERYKLMLEPLVIPTEKQMEIVEGDKEAYDLEMRPKLMELMMEEMQGGGVEPSVWKVEGVEEAEDYEMLVEQAHSGGREADIIILGRHADDEQVEKWLEAGAKMPGVTGFAVGRTIFWDPLVECKEGRIAPERASEMIASNFVHFYKIFKGK